MSVSTPPPTTVVSTTTNKANLWQSMALGGAAASFAVNFTHPIVRICISICNNKNFLCIDNNDQSYIHHLTFLFRYTCQIILFFIGEI